MITGKIFTASALITLLTLVTPAGAQKQEPIGVITELKLNRGDIQIQLPGKTTSQRPAVLQSLFPGTRILASKDAVAVILLMDGSKIITVNEKNSPTEIKGVQAKGREPNALEQVAVLLLGKKQPPTYVALATRGGKGRPTILSPRDTKLMSEAPNLQWMGMDQQTGTVRVFGPQGLIWTAENLALTQIKYPSSAPPLLPGIEYSWSLEKNGFPPEKTSFKLLSSEDALRIQERLASLQKTAAATSTTLAILKASFLISNELFHDTREILITALRTDPDEPTLHLLLGDIYDRTGLKNLAAEEYGEAEFLSKGPLQ
jgi:hypothetical protein